MSPEIERETAQMLCDENMALRAERDALRAEVKRLRLDVGRLLVAYGSRDEFDGVDDAIEDAAEMRAENNRLRAFVRQLRDDGLDIDDPTTAPVWTGKIHAPDGRLLFDLATVGADPVTDAMHGATGVPRSALCHHQDRPHCAGCPDDATCEASGREPRQSAPPLVSEQELLDAIREAVRVELQRVLQAMPQPKQRRPRALLSARAAAEALGVSRSTVAEWIARKKLRVVPVGRQQRIPVSEIERVQREGVTAA